MGVFAHITYVTETKADRETRQVVRELLKKLKSISFFNIGKVEFNCSNAIMWEAVGKVDFNRFNDLFSLKSIQLFQCNNVGGSWKG